MEAIRPSTATYGRLPDAMPPGWFSDVPAPWMVLHLPIPYVPTAGQHLTTAFNVEYSLSPQFKQLPYDSRTIAIRSGAAQVVSPRAFRGLSLIQAQWQTFPIRLSVPAFFVPSGIRFVCSGWEDTEMPRPFVSDRRLYTELREAAEHFSGKCFQYLGSPSVE